MVAVLGIAGTVGVFVAMLALARGFKATLTSSGLPAERHRAAGRRGHRDDERPAGRRRADRGGRAAGGPRRVGPAREPGGGGHRGAAPARRRDADANVQIRGVSPRVLDVRDNVKIVEGRFLTPGLAEAVVGKGARSAYVGLDLGATVRIGAGTWTIVGVFDGKGTAFDSEVWADADMLERLLPAPAVRLPVGHRPPAVGRRLPRLRGDAQGRPAPQRAGAARDRRTTRSSREVVTTLITVLGSLIAVVMGLGAVFGALNTMYSAVSERSREIAVLRAIGFGGGAIVLSFFVESLIIAFVGGLVGCVAVLPVNGLTTGTINWQTFSHLAFAFRITPGPAGAGDGVRPARWARSGGLPPAIRAARANVAHTLRAL